jgi:uncharacterized protein (TIGR02001 family)
LAWADEAAPDNQFSYGLGATTDYRFRGMSRTARSASGSASASFSNAPTGIYGGLTASKVTFIQNIPGAGSTPLEWTLNLGKAGDLGNGFGYDVGGSAFVYLNTHMKTNPNTGEVHARLTYNHFYANYSRSLTDLFGSANSKGSGYLLVGANATVFNDFSFDAHTGRQLVTNHANERYVDWGLSLGRDFGLAFVNLSIVGTIVVDRSAYTNASGKFLGPTSLVLSATKSF